MSVFELFAEEYDQWYKNHENFYLSELRALERAVPKNKYGLEIGSGTGRFAIPLGLHEGVEPSLAMRRVAFENGFESIDGIAENLPFHSNLFDFALMVTTVCFIQDIKKAFLEAYRVLKLDGRLIIGFVDKNSFLGKKYFKEKENNKFYKDAIFYGAEELANLLKDSGFVEFKYYQTLFSPAEDRIENPEEGYGKGSFIVIEAKK